MMKRRVGTGAAIVIATALWAGRDALVHVRADEVEPPCIAGNVATFVACGLSVAVVQFWRASKIAALVCGVAAGVVLGLNLAWANVHRELPAPALVFFGLAVLLLLLAAWRFFGEAAASTSVGDAGDAPSRPKLWVGTTVALFLVAGQAGSCSGRRSR